MAHFSMENLAHFCMEINNHAFATVSDLEIVEQK